MKYIQLYESLRSGIVQGIWKYGTRLPSKRQLSEEYAISVITVEHSLELLMQEGYIEIRPRSGCYVCYRADVSFRPELVVHDQPAISDSEHRNYDCFPFPALARTMRRVLSDYGDRVLIKSPNNGHALLRQALAAYLGRNRGMRVAPDQIIIGSGAEYLYGLAAEMFGSGIVIGVEDPCYRKIEQVYRNRGVQLEFLPLGSDGINSLSLQNSRADVLHISPFRSYPSLITASASKRAEYVLWAQRKDRYIIEDDYESEFSLLRKPEDTVFALSTTENVIYMNTFTKTISPSLRIGYMVLPARLLPLYEERVGFYSCTVPTFEQLVLTDIITSGDFERHINRIRRKLRKSNE